MANLIAVLTNAQLSPTNQTEQAMRRTALFVLAFVAGSAVGWIARDRPKSARPVRDPVWAISIAPPESAPAVGLGSGWFRVVAWGDEKAAVGVQQPNEWNVVLWHLVGDDEPKRCERFRLVPLARE